MNYLFLYSTSSSYLNEGNEIGFLKSLGVSYSICLFLFCTRLTRTIPTTTKMTSTMITTTATPACVSDAGVMGMLKLEVVVVVSDLVVVVATDGLLFSVVTETGAAVVVVVVGGGGVAEELFEGLTSEGSLAFAVVETVLDVVDVAVVIVEFAKVVGFFVVGGTALVGVGAARVVFVVCAIDSAAAVVNLSPVVSPPVVVAV